MRSINSGALQPDRLRGQNSTRSENGEGNVQPGHNPTGLDAGGPSQSEYIAERNAAIRRRRTEEQNSLLPRRSLVDVLRASSRLPQMPTKLPKTYKALLQQWAVHGLQEFENVPRKNWTNNSVRQAYEKYLYLFKYVKKCNGESGGAETMQQTATRLDASFLGPRMSLAGHYKLLKLNDPNVIPRSRTWRGARPRGNIGQTTTTAQAARTQPTRTQPTRTLAESARRHEANQNVTRDHSLRFASRPGQPNRHNTVVGPPRRFVAHAEGGIDGRRQNRNYNNSGRAPSAYDAPTETYNCEDDANNRYTSGGSYRLV